MALSWSGTRGVISLAAIFTLPLTTNSGDPFPDRDLLLFCTFVVVLVTLVGQGLTFAPLVRMLGLRADEKDQARVRNEARSAAVEAALARLDTVAAEEPDSTVAVDTTRAQLQTRLARYRGRLDLIEQSGSSELPTSPEYETALRVRRTVPRSAARGVAAVARLRTAAGRGAARAGTRTRPRGTVAAEAGAGLTRRPAHL
ncbi:cation:proton antiporter [Micromonospora sp. BRA006-A]|nr:cation:proton antiporter [Micromonospora sp. BRA006-A]